MNCTSFRDAVHELDRDDLLDAGTYDAAIEHAQTCTRCARLIYQTRRLDASLRALARADANREAPPRVQAQLMRAFRAQAPVKIGAGRLIQWLGAAAAILVLAGGTFLAWRHERASAPGQSIPVQAVATRPSVDRVQAASSAPMPLLDSTLKARSPRDHKRHVAEPIAQFDQTDDLGEFIELPYADDDAPLGAGEMVRVRLSESSLGLMGFPVSGDAATEPVTADVVIGEDGVARAIRFVPAPESELAQLRTTTSDSKGAKQQ